MRIERMDRAAWYKRFGLGIKFETGNLGTTWGEKGWNMCFRLEDREKLFELVKKHNLTLEEVMRAAFHA